MVARQEKQNESESGRDDDDYQDEDEDDAYASKSAHNGRNERKERERERSSLHIYIYMIRGAYTYTHHIIGENFWWHEPVCVNTVMVTLGEDHLLLISAASSSPPSRSQSAWIGAASGSRFPRVSRAVPGAFSPCVGSNQCHPPSISAYAIYTIQRVCTSHGTMIVSASASLQGRVIDRVVYCHLRTSKK